MARYGKTAVDNIMEDRPQSQNVDDVVKWMFLKDDDEPRTLVGRHLLQRVKGTSRGRLYVNYV